EVFPVQRELLDTVVAAVGQEHGPVANRQPCRPVQLAVSRTRLAPFAQEITAFVEDGNPVQPLVGDIDILLAIQGDGGGPDELTVAFAARAELTDVVFVERDYRYMHPIRPVFIGPVHDIHHIIGAQGQVHRVPETRPGKLVAANGVAVGEGTVLNPKKMCTHRFSPVVTVCIGPFSLPPADRARGREKQESLRINSGISPAQSSHRRWAPEPGPASPPGWWSRRNGSPCCTSDCRPLPAYSAPGRGIRRRDHP